MADTATIAMIAAAQGALAAFWPRFKRAVVSVTAKKARDQARSRGNSVLVDVPKSLSSALGYWTAWGKNRLIQIVHSFFRIKE